MIDQATWAIVDISADESRRLREMPYEEFLNSPYWRAVRRIKLDQAGGKCEKCHKPATDLQLHHKRYTHHGREHRHLNDLLVWCGACHSRWHFSQIEVHTKTPGKGRPRKDKRGKRKRTIYFR